MDWTKFNNHGESPNHAFEVMCNILFKCWLKKEYKDKYFSLCVCKWKWWRWWCRSIWTFKIR